MKAVIFDCFGVLYPDTFWVIVNKFVPDWEARDPQAYHDIVARVDAGMTDRDDFWNETAEACGITRTRLDDEIKAMGSVDKELLSYITELRKRHFKTSMLSNVGRGFVERIFEGLSIQDYFDDIVLSSEVGFAKPDHEIFEMAAERLGVELYECVFIDDRARFCSAAEALGMKALLYKSLDKLKKDLEPLLS
jgi:epoxide hydrolase-like predicted phosphatase